MEHVVGDIATVTALEGSLVVVEHGLEHRQDGFVRDLQVEEGVEHPGGGADTALVLEGVFFEHGHEVGDRERAFREAQARAETADFLGHGFVGLGLAALGGFPVRVLEEVLPGGFDVGCVAVVGGLVDEDAEVEVAGLVGVVVV